MMEFILTQSYATLEEMLNSAEVDVYKEDLQRGTYEKYAIVSRIGNRYDLEGKKIEGFVDNPFYKTQRVEVCEEAKPIPVVCEIEEKNMEETNMKYPEIEAFVDGVVEKQVEGVKLAYEEEISKIKAQHEQYIDELKALHEVELMNAKAKAKSELLAKLND